MQRDLHFGHLTLNRTRAKPFLCEKFGGPVYKFSGVVSPLSVKTLEHKHNCSYVFAGYIRSLSCWTLALGIQWTTRQLLNFQSKIVAHLEINNI